MTTPTTFGEYIKELRLEQRVSLRAFAESIGSDPGNYSKIERGKMAPPADAAKLDIYRKALCLDANDLRWREAVRLASIHRGEVPPRILNDEQLVGKLPALFRTLEGDAVDETLLDELIATIRREY